MPTEKIHHVHLYVIYHNYAQRDQKIIAIFEDFNKAQNACSNVYNYSIKRINPPTFIVDKNTVIDLDMGIYDMTVIVVNEHIILDIQN